MAEPRVSLWKVITGISIVVAGAFCFLMSADAKQDKEIICKLESIEFAKYATYQEKRYDKYDGIIEKFDDKMNEFSLQQAKIITILEERPCIGVDRNPAR